MLIKIKKLLVSLRDNFFLLLALGIITNNITHLFRMIRVDFFYEDEFQHTHITWRTFKGDLLYRDFFEHHGSLYPLFNKIVLTIIQAKANFETFITLRTMSFVFLCLILLMIYLIVKKITLSQHCAVYAAAFFTMFNAVQIYSCQVRPDLIQVFVMLVGAYLLIKYFESCHRIGLFCSGICFGLMLGFNFKTILVLVALFAFCVSEKFVFNNDKALKKLLYIFSGVLLVVLGLFCFFWIQGALPEFLYYNTIFNTYFNKLAPWIAKTAKRHTFQSFLDHNLFLTLFSFVAIITTPLNNWKNRLFAWIIILTSYGSFYGLFPYYAMIYLPFVCYFLAIFIDRFLFQNLYNQDKPMRLKFGIVLLLFFGFGATGEYIASREDYSPTPRYKDQKAKVKWVQKNLDPAEEIAMIKTGCIPYVFNKQHKYFWILGPAESKAARVNLARDLIKTMEAKKTQYIFATPREVGFKPKYLQKYIRENFEIQKTSPEETYNCTWRRKHD